MGNKNSPAAKRAGTKALASSKLSILKSKDSGAAGGAHGSPGNSSGAQSTVPIQPASTLSSNIKSSPERETGQWQLPSADSSNAIQVEENLAEEKGNLSRILEISRLDKQTCKSVQSSSGSDKINDSKISHNVTAPAPSSEVKHAAVGDAKSDEKVSQESTQKADKDSTACVAEGDGSPKKGKEKEKITDFREALRQRVAMREARAIAAAATAASMRTSSMSHIPVGSTSSPRELHSVAGAPSNVDSSPKIVLTNFNLDGSKRVLSESSADKISSPVTVDAPSMQSGVSVEQTRAGDTLPGLQSFHAASSTTIAGTSAETLKDTVAEVLSSAAPVHLSYGPSTVDSSVKSLPVSQHPPFMSPSPRAERKEEQPQPSGQVAGSAGSSATPVATTVQPQSAGQVEVEEKVASTKVESKAAVSSPRPFLKMLRRREALAQANVAVASQRPDPAAVVVARSPVSQVLPAAAPIATGSAPSNRTGVLEAGAAGFEDPKPVPRPSISSPGAAPAAAADYMSSTLKFGTEPTTFSIVPESYFKETVDPAPTLSSSSSPPPLSDDTRQRDLLAAPYEAVPGPGIHTYTSSNPDADTQPLSQRRSVPRRDVSIPGRSPVSPSSSRPLHPRRISGGDASLRLHDGDREKARQVELETSLSPFEDYVRLLSLPLQQIKEELMNCDGLKLPAGVSANRYAVALAIVKNKYYGIAPEHRTLPPASSLGSAACASSSPAAATRSSSSSTGRLGKNLNRSASPHSPQTNRGGSNVTSTNRPRGDITSTEHNRWERPWRDNGWTPPPAQSRRRSSSTGNNNYYNSMRSSSTGRADNDLYGEMSLGRSHSTGRMHPRHSFNSSISGGNSLYDRRLHSSPPLVATGIDTGAERRRPRPRRSYEGNTLSTAVRSEDTAITHAKVLATAKRLEAHTGSGGKPRSPDVRHRGLSSPPPDIRRRSLSAGRTGLSTEYDASADDNGYGGSGYGAGRRGSSRITPKQEGIRWRSSQRSIDRDYDGRGSVNTADKSDPYRRSNSAAAAGRRESATLQATENGATRRRSLLADQTKKSHAQTDALGANGTSRIVGLLKRKKMRELAASMGLAEGEGEDYAADRHFGGFPLSEMPSQSQQAHSLSTRSPEVLQAYLAAADRAAARLNQEAGIDTITTGSATTIEDVDHKQVPVEYNPAVALMMHNQNQVMKHIPTPHTTTSANINSLRGLQFPPSTPSNASTATTPTYASSKLLSRIMTAQRQRGMAVSGGSRGASGGPNKGQGRGDFGHIRPATEVPSRLSVVWDIEAEEDSVHEFEAHNQQPLGREEVLNNQGARTDAAAAAVAAAAVETVGKSKRRNSREGVSSIGGGGGRNSPIVQMSMVTGGAGSPLLPGTAPPQPPLSVSVSMDDQPQQHSNSYVDDVASSLSGSST